MKVSKTILPAIAIAMTMAVGLQPPIFAQNIVSVFLGSESAVSHSNSSYRIIGTVGQPFITLVLDSALVPSQRGSNNLTRHLTANIDQSSVNIPSEYRLIQNYPNPFNPETTITYQLPKSGRVELTIYNMLGEKIRTLVNKDRPAGIHQAQWHGKDDQGRQVSSGVYVYRIKTGEFSQTRKMVVVR